MTDMVHAVNIIVIGYTVSEKMKQIESNCVNSVVANTEYPYHLTYYNNYKSGYSLTNVWNKFIRASKHKYICLLNSDTVVYPGWLTKLVETLDSDNTVGFVGPSTNNCHGSQRNVPSLEAASQLPCNSVRVSNVPLCGFCLLFEKQTFMNLGGFDERFKLYGQESDLLKRAQEKGYRFAWRQDAFVYHIGEATMKAAKVDIKSERAVARAMYNSKHGRTVHRRPAKPKEVKRKIKTVVIPPISSNVLRKYK